MNFLVLTATLLVAALGLGFLAIRRRAATKSLRAENAALRESHERYRLAVAGSDDGVFDWDYRSGRAFDSARARELLGLPPGPEMQTTEEWIAAVNAHLHPDDVSRWAVEIDAHMSGRTPTYEGEFRVRNGAGGYRWVRVRALCVRDAAGIAYRMAGSVSDVDARKRAEESLRVSEERYAIAMTGSEESHWVWNVQTDELFASQQAHQLYGIPESPALVTRSEWVARMPMHADDRPRVEQAVREHLAGRTQRLDVEYRLLDATGAPTRWVHARGQCFRDAEGKPDRVAGSTVEITQRKRAEELLRQSEERYQLAVEGANQGLWDWDLVRNMLFISPRAQELLGLTPAEPLRPRREWISCLTFHSDDIATVRSAIGAHLRGVDKFFAVECRIQHRSGAWHWYRYRGVALRVENTRPYRMAGSMEDITEQKDAEAERARLETQLLQAKKLESIGTLAGGIAHDFNNILAAILGNGEMAQSEATLGSSLRRHVDAVVSAGTRAKSLVERILAFSRSGMGDRIPVHVESVVDEALHLIASSLPGHVRFERQLQAVDARVLGDPTQVHQVVMNLCTNAIQAMKSDGTLSVALEVVERAETTAPTSAFPSGRYVRLRVRDTGTGIPENALERIFDPFFTTKDVGVGTGLGLSLVHGIVTDLGGGIDVESKVGVGTTFTVYLPWNSSLAEPENVEDMIQVGAGETILLVDDEEALVRLGEDVLARLGYEPVGFTSSVAALEDFRASPERFHAVLSDQAMPDMTGVELAKEIRVIRPELPIVLMSGFVSSALVARAKGIGVNEVLVKPLTARDIARTLAGVLASREATPP